MTTHRYYVKAIVILATLIIAAFGGAGKDDKDRDCDVTPIADCAYKDSSGRWIIVFGYSNPENMTCKIPIDNSKNMFTPPMKDQNQPTEFLPGVHHGVISTYGHGGVHQDAMNTRVRCENGDADWHLGHRSALGKPSKLPLCCAIHECQTAAKAKANPFPKLMKGSDTAGSKTSSCCCPPPPPPPPPTTAPPPPPTTRSTRPPVTTITTTRTSAPTQPTRPSSPPSTTPCTTSPDGRRCGENVTTDDIDIDLNSYCSIAVGADGNGEFYMFALSQIVPDDWRVLITLGPYNDNIRLRGTCDSMATDNDDQWEDLWTPLRVQNGWQLLSNLTSMRYEMKKPVSVTDLEGCKDADGLPALDVCENSDIDSHCLGKWFATVLRAVDDEDEAAGEEVLYTVPCNFNIQERLGGTVSTTFHSDLLNVAVTWLNTHCLPDSHLTSFTVQTCLRPYTLDDPVRLVNPIIVSHSNGITFSADHWDVDCTVRGNRCCQRWTFTASQLPPLSASALIQWNPEINGLVSEQLFVKTHVNLHIGDTCDGMDVGFNFTCDAELHLYDDEELEDEYFIEQSPPILDGSRAYAFVNLSEECCVDANRQMKIHEVRLCWSANDVQVVPLDPANPDTTGCNTEGIDLRSDILYDDSGYYNPDYDTEIADAGTCGRVVSWVVRMRACEDTVNVVEVDWRAVKRQPFLLGAGKKPECHGPHCDPDTDYDDNSYYLHTVHVRADAFVVSCNETDLIWDSHEGHCRHTNFWNWSSHLLFIFGVIAIIILFTMCIIGCCMTAFAGHHHHHHEEVAQVVQNPNEYTFVYRLPTTPNSAAADNHSKDM
jgi:hypothetical protein